MKMKLIVGLVGRIGCGKSTVGGYLKDNYSAVELRYSGILTEVLETLNLQVTRENLQARIEAEFCACQGKRDLAEKAKQLNYDSVHDVLHEMCKDEARHGKASATF